MITGNIKDCEKYFSINKCFKEVFAVLKTLDKYSETCEIKEENVFGNISETETSDTEEGGGVKPFEAHREFIDLHFIIDGCEDFGYANINTLEALTEYNCKDDYILLKGNGNRITLYKGDFAIVFPEDAHIPAMKCNNGRKVKRAVVKIPAQNSEKK